MAIPMTPAALALLEQVAAGTPEGVIAQRQAPLEQAANGSVVPPVAPAAPAAPAPEVATPAPVPAPGNLELVARAGAAVANPMMAGLQFVGAVAQKAKAAHANAPPSAPLSAATQKPLPGADAAPAASEGPPAPTVVDLSKFGGPQQTAQQASTGAGVSMGARFSGAPGANVGDPLRTMRAAEGALRGLDAAMASGDAQQIDAIQASIEALGAEQGDIVGETKGIIEETRSATQRALAARAEVLRRADEMYSEAAVFERYPGATASEIPALLDATRTLQKQIIPADEMVRRLNAGDEMTGGTVMDREVTRAPTEREVMGNVAVDRFRAAAGLSPAVADRGERVGLDAGLTAEQQSARDAKIQAIRDNYATEEEAARARSFLAQKSRPEDVYPQGWALALSLIGVGLGGLGQRPGEENHALRIMQSGIDRKIAMQKAEAERRQQGVVSARNMYESIRARANDDVTAVATTRAAMLEQNANLLRMVGERVTNKKMQGDLLMASDAAHRESVRLSAQIQEGIVRSANDRGRLELDRARMSFDQMMAARVMDAKQQEQAGTAMYAEPIEGALLRYKPEDVIKKTSALVSAATLSKQVINKQLERRVLLDKIAKGLGGDGQVGAAEQLLSGVLSQDSNAVNQFVSWAANTGNDHAKSMATDPLYGVGLVVDSEALQKAKAEHPAVADLIEQYATLSAEMSSNAIANMSSFAQAYGSGVLQPSEVGIWLPAIGDQKSNSIMEVSKPKSAYKTLFDRTGADLSAGGYRFRKGPVGAMTLDPEQWDVASRWEAAKQGRFAPLENPRTF